MVDNSQKLQLMDLSKGDKFKWANPITPDLADVTLEVITSKHYIRISDRQVKAIAVRRLDTGQSWIIHDLYMYVIPL